MIVAVNAWPLSDLNAIELCRAQLMRPRPWPSD